MPGFENFAGRQYPLSIYKRFRAADLNRLSNGVAVTNLVLGYITIPPKALVTLPIQFIVTALLTSATGTLTFVDDANSSTIVAKDLHSGATTAAIQAAGYVDSGRRVKVMLTANGSVGGALDSRIEGTYILEGRSNEVAPERGDKIAAL